MDISKAPDCVNRSTLWVALYKAGIPTQAMQNIRQGHQSTKLQRKDAGTYGEPIRNNVGVFQLPALSALLFIIYLDDVVQDLQSLNDLMQLPKRQSNQPEEEVRAKQLLTRIARITKPETEILTTDTVAKTTTQDTIEQEKAARADEVIYDDDANVIAGGRFSTANF